MKKHNRVTLIDWFDENGILKQTFNSYQHVADVFKKEYKNEKINYNCIKKLINNKYSIFFKDLKKPDIRFHQYEKKEIIENRICTNCNESKPFTKEFFYIYDSGRYEVKCKKCNLIRIGDKHIKTFMETINDDWKFHPKYTDIYFERNTEQIFNTKSGKYLTPCSLVNICGKLSKDLKWEAFNGFIEENKIVKYIEGKSIILDNLVCEYVYCKFCNEIIKNPYFITEDYCSKKCLLKMKVMKEKELRHNSIIYYLSNKYSSQKYINKNKHGIEIDYDLDYLIYLGNKCFYCEVECSFGNKEYTPDALTIDRKDSSIGYCKENIVICCWFCNMMKNKSLYGDWMQFINFVKDPKETILDLSNKKYCIESYAFNSSNIYFHIKEKSKKYYPSLSSARNVFLNLCKQQEYKDPIFYFFPIIYLERNCLWNASVDAIDSTLPEEEKHKPDNLQIIPKIFNYGKHIHSQEDFIKEWKKRNFKTDFSKCKIVLPEKYYEDCYFHKMITK